jgi:hypothetical protein
MGILERRRETIRRDWSSTRRLRLDDGNLDQHRFRGLNWVFYCIGLMAMVIYSLFRHEVNSCRRSLYSIRLLAGLGVDDQIDHLSTYIPDWYDRIKKVTWLLANMVYAYY